MRELIRDGTDVSDMSTTVKMHIKRVRREIYQWRHRARGEGSETGGLDAGDSTKSVLDREELDEDALWAQFDLAPGSHLTHTPTPLWAPSDLSTLHAFLHHVQSRLLPPDSPTLPLFISSHLLSPLLAHGKLVSTSLVSLYLDDLQLLGHYNVMRDYFLGGNVSFIERVSAALFGKEEAGAGEALGLGKRARTRARLGLGGDETGSGGEWGIGLGLGLSERARWPPGGAELACALRTTLVDQSVADQISFAVRNLPEDTDGKRARWLDPQGES